MMMAMTAAILCAAQATGPAPEKGPAPSAFVEPQDPDRIPIPLAELKSLRENNVFSPHKTVKKEPPVRTSRTHDPKPPPPPPKPKPPLVTGILLDPQTKAYQVVVEDRNETRLRLLKEPVFLKAGDEVLVYRIESVTTDRVVVRFGESTKEIKVGEALPEAGLKAPEGAETPVAPEGEEPAGDAKSDVKSESNPSESSTSPSLLQEEKQKKIREEMMKRLKKNRIQN